MSTLKFLLQKEFRQIFRNPTILRMILLVPVVQLIILPLAADFEIKNINISIVDNDRSGMSQDLIEDIKSSGYFRLINYTHDFQIAFSDIESDEADIVLEIPNGLERDMIRERSGALFIAVNAINGTKAYVGGAYLSRIISAFNQDLRTEFSSENRGTAIGVAVINWFNPMLNYQFFMVPGILVVLVTMVGGYMTSLNIVKEKEVGTIEQINVTPIRKTHFILGKLIPFWVLCVIVFTLGMFVVARIIYGIVPLGSIFVLYGYLALYLVAILGVALLISTYSNTQQQAMSLSFFMMMIFILMSGLFTPIESMPQWAQWIAALNPVTYFVQVMRMIVMKGSEFGHITKHFLIMVAFAVVFNSWAILNYKKTS
ncbi:MAG: ABC transporter permease [Cyclobacteriaceae bacterium]|nr:ABC transporter permease [Cyclobacteriaceae bacterium SS2]